MFEVDSRQFDGLEIGNRRPQQQIPLLLWVNRVALAMSASSPVHPPTSDIRLTVRDGSEWNGPAALRPNVLAAALANKLARIRLDCAGARARL